MQCTYTNIRQIICSLTTKISHWTIHYLFYKYFERFHGFACSETTCPPLSRLPYLNEQSTIANMTLHVKDKKQVLFKAYSKLHKSKLFSWTLKLRNNKHKKMSKTLAMNRTRRHILLELLSILFLPEKHTT